MAKKEQAFWSGAAEGFWKGGLTVFLTLGAIGAAVGLVSSVITSPLILLSAELIIGGFVSFALHPLSLMASAASATLYGLYNGIDNYLEERELERNRKRIKDAAKKSVTRTVTDVVKTTSQAVDSPTMQQVATIEQETEQPSAKTVLQTENHSQKEASIHPEPKHDRGKEEPVGKATTKILENRIPTSRQKDGSPIAR